MSVAGCGNDISVTEKEKDDDGDGYAVAIDCDDGHATVNPDAPEVCDGVDNDCDGDVDEDATDATTFYADTDGDGAGDAASTTVACELPAGFVATGDDCDDTEARAWPGNVEVCDGIDNDCDHAVDNDASDVATVFADADGDGYGDPSLPLPTCDPVEGYVADATDCDDDDPDIHPGAAEVCTDPVDRNCDHSTTYADADGDGTAACEDCDDTNAARAPTLPERCDEANLDEDCDGLADDADSSATGQVTWYADTDADSYGDATATEAACDAPAGDVATANDCDDTDAHINPAATEVCDGVDNDCDALVDDADASVSGTSAWYADADGDGYGAGAALVECVQPAGSVGNSTDCDDANAGISPADVEICDAANTDEDCDGFADDADSAATGKTTWYRDADADTFGTSTSTHSACDVPVGYVSDDTDCDDTDNAVNPGAPEVCANGVDDDCDTFIDEACGISGTFSSADADVMIYGESSGDGFGTSVSGGFDFDADGTDDIVVGAPSDDDGNASGGALYLYTGDVAAGSIPATADDDFKLYGTTFYGDAGLEVWGVPDLDGDGDAEILALGDGTSTLNVVLGQSPMGTATLSSRAATTFPYCEEVAFAGHSDALTGNNDWMCGWSYDSSSIGKVTVYSGVSTVVGTLTGEAVEDYAGYAITGAEDLDGDGYDDYLVGAYGNDLAGENAGAAYVVYAPVAPSATTPLASADVKLTGATAGDAFGSMALLGDMDGDGGADVVVGAALNSDVAYRAGAIYVFAGPLASSITAASASAAFYGATDDEIGNAGVGFMSVGDADGDGQLDLLVGAGRNDAAGTSAGQAWLIYGPLSGTHDLGAGLGYDAAFQGGTDHDTFGQSGTLASDLNADGLDDIVISALYADGGSDTNQGAVYVYYGR